MGSRRCVSLGVPAAPPANHRVCRLQVLSSRAQYPDGSVSDRKCPFESPIARVFHDGTNAGIDPLACASLTIGILSTRLPLEARVQDEPPKSVSISAPLITPSEQVASPHVPPRQRSLWQSASRSHIRPGSQSGRQRAEASHPSPRPTSDGERSAHGPSVRPRSGASSPSGFGVQ